ncbi:MAG: hypothetical protein ACYSU0_11580 [Planctomycetota bacterium]|jgi:hypothetical protein
MSPEVAADKPSPSFRAVLWRWRLVLAAAVAWVVTMGLYALVVSAVFSGLRVNQPESMGWLTVAAEAAACGVSLAVWGVFVYVAGSALRASFGSVCLASGAALGALALVWIARAAKMGRIESSGLGISRYVALVLVARFVVPFAYCVVAALLVGMKRAKEGEQDG